MKTPMGAEDPLDDCVYRVLYSSAVPRSRSADEVERDLELILRASRRYNSDFGITGVLVTNKRMYCQVIEGPRLIIQKLVGHIACDTRHCCLRIISRHSAQQRIFADWSMAFVRTNRDLEAEAYFFPSTNEASAVTAISAFCISVRKHVLSGTYF